MIEGQFIVIEGIDGAGTTTQASLLAQRLSARGLPVHETHEPSDGPVGMLIRQTLRGRVVIPGRHGGRPLTWSTMATLFAADRLDHLEAEILPNLLDGVTVICDRYDHSSVAYQTVTSSGKDEVEEWVLALNRYARRPDLTIVLDVDPSVAASRRKARPGHPEIYEEDALQSELGKFYADIDRLFPGDRIVHVDANREVAQVADAVWAEVASLRGEPA